MQSRKAVCHSAAVTAESSALECNNSAQKLTELGVRIEVERDIKDCSDRQRSRLRSKELRRGTQKSEAEASCLWFIVCSLPEEEANSVFAT